MNIVQIMNAAFTALVIAEFGATRYDYELSLWDDLNPEHVAECKAWIADIIGGMQLGVSFSASAYRVIPCLR